MSALCPVMRSCEEFGASYVIARSRDENDKTIALHVYVENPENAAELDELLIKWEADREEAVA